MKSPATILLLCLSFCASALHATERLPAAFASLVKDDAGKTLATELALDHRKDLARHGIREVRFFTEQLASSRVLLCTFDVEGGKEPEEVWIAARKDKALAAWWGRMDAALAPHPYAAPGGPWAACETLCKLRPRVPGDLRGDKPVWQAAVTGLKAEKEAEYRTLHAAVWPGVVDAIGKSGISRFDVFLTEVDGRLYLFYLMEFIGRDLAKDTATMAKNPVNQRWWKITDPCQEPLPGPAAKKQIWEEMEPAADLAK